MKNLRFSVIIPAYNEEDSILLCLRSLEEQTFPKEKYEVIVVDNNSHDKTAALVKNYFPKVRIIKEKKQGVVFARIKGVESSRGDIIAFIDADCVASSLWLEKIQQAYEKNPDAVAVGGDYAFDETNPWATAVGILPQIVNRLLKMMPGANMSFKKQAYFQCGGFSPKVNLTEDLYLSKKLKKVGRIVYLTNNIILTSSRRFWSLDSLDYVSKFFVNAFSLYFTDKPLFFNFKPVRKKIFGKNFQKFETIIKKKLDLAKIKSLIR